VPPPVRIALFIPDLSNRWMGVDRMRDADTSIDLVDHARRVYEAVAADPDSPTYLFNQASALSAAGELAQAEAAFRRCIQVAPSLVGAHTGLGIVLAETGRLPEAAVEFRAALALHPDDPAALDDLKRAEGMLDRR